MKIVLKSILLASLALVTFSCKDKVIEKPDSLNPIELTLAEIVINWSKYENQTVMIDSVYFVHPAGTKFNDSGSNSGGEKNLSDCDGNSAIVFTYASDDWALKEVPTKMGKFYAVITQYNGELQLRMRSYDDVKEMTLDKCPEKVEVITIPQFLTGAYNGKLVKILDVQFDEPAGTKFNGTASNGGGSKDLVDCDGNSTIVFTYTSDPWTNEEVPQGNGYIIAMGSEFGTTKQLRMRSLDDVAAMTGTRCTTGGGGTCTDYFCDDFEGGSLTGNNTWTVVNVVGSYPWLHKSFSGNYFAEANGYSGSAQNAETWLISPAVDLSSSTNPILTFDNDKYYSGPDMQLYVSTSYNGSGTINMGDWTEITGFTKSTGSGFVSSGNLSMTSFKGTNTYIAFRYTSTTGTNTAERWRVDNILIKE